MIPINNNNFNNNNNPYTIMRFLACTLPLLLFTTHHTQVASLSLSSSVSSPTFTHHHHHHHHRTTNKRTTTKTTTSHNTNKPHHHPFAFDRHQSQSTTSSSSSSLTALPFDTEFLSSIPTLLTDSLPLSTFHHATNEFLSTIPHFLTSSTTEAALTIPDLTTTTDTLAATTTSLGHDIFIFLIVSVLVVPLCKSLNITPVLGFLAVGCLLGPYGLGVFSNTEADIELGDFGILFLLFNEGLSLSPDRIKELTRFTGLGVFQLLLSIALIFIGTFWGGPILIANLDNVGIPLDTALLQPLFDTPVEAFCIAAAGALSSSAFVLPILKSRRWEDKPEGIAGLSILLLQDLSVAPLLVLLPLLAAGSRGDGGVGIFSPALGIVLAKATLGFGAVLTIGSWGLRYVFDIVAAARSTETFVAAALLVAVGMGQTADYLGLSASTGAFAAGVLLAGNRYRAQIQADIRPFEGILLGIFFITAGAGLDPSVVVEDWLILGGGIWAFIGVKAGIIFSSGGVLGLTRGQAARVAFTLAGGGEFALVLFKLAEDLEVLPLGLAKLLIASVIISMSLTPVLGEVGARLGNYIEELDGDVRGDGLTVEEEERLFDQIDTDGSGTIELDELRDALLKLDFPYVSIADAFHAFDLNGNGVIEREEWGRGIREGLLNEAFNANSKEALSRKDLHLCKDALVICGFGEVGKSLYNLLLQSKHSSASTGGVAIFDLNPARVTSATLSSAPVVFGDGARLDLLRAAGVTAPRAVVITYAARERLIDATQRLRAGLGDEVAIYAYGGGVGGVEGGQGLVKELMEAGATEVVGGTVETVVRFAELVGAGEGEEDGWLKMISMEGGGVGGGWKG